MDPLCRPSGHEGYVGPVNRVFRYTREDQHVSNLVLPDGSAVGTKYLGVPRDNTSPLLDLLLKIVHEDRDETNGILTVACFSNLRSHV